MELQLHGSAPRPEHALRAGAEQPQGVLPWGNAPLHNQIRDLTDIWNLQVHRPSHFMNFASIEEGGEPVGADREDMFS